MVRPVIPQERPAPPDAGRHHQVAQRLREGPLPVDGQVERAGRHRRRPLVAAPVRSNAAQAAPSPSGSSARLSRLFRLSRLLRQVVLARDQQPCPTCTTRCALVSSGYRGSMVGALGQVVAGGPCPCGTGTGYADCCGPLHQQERLAETAEELMRSRYAAYAVRDFDHLVRTWHPRTRPTDVDADEGIVWDGLTIVGTRAGGPGDARSSSRPGTAWTAAAASCTSAAGSPAGPAVGSTSTASRTAPDPGVRGWRSPGG